MGFKEVVEATPNLRGQWKTGLRALRTQDKFRIKPEDTTALRLRGSVDIDTALRSREPTANRWDFAIGYQHANRADEFIYWVETHTASDRQISVMLRKLAWLKTWLNGDGRELQKFDRSFVWVPSGATEFTEGSTQVKILADKGLSCSGSIFKIPVNHPKAKAG